MRGKDMIILVALVLVASMAFMPYGYSKSDTDIKNDDRIDNFDDNSVKIEKSLQKKFSEQDDVKVIIMLKPKEKSEGGNSARSRSSRIASIQDENPGSAIPSIDIEGFEKERDLGVINAVSGTLTREGFNTLKNSGMDIVIFEDKDLYVHATSLSSAIGSINANYSRNVLGINGSGIKIGFIDTGINYTQVDFGGCYGNNTNASCRVFGGYDFYNNDANPMDDHTYGHGSHVAGIAGARGNIIGVAPNATLYALKACGSGGSCPTSAVIEAINWSINNSLDVLSVSLGSYASYEDLANTGKDPLSLAIDNAVSQGIVVVVSSGNNGPGVSTINTPGAAESAITVGAIDTQETSSIADDELWLESSVGPSAFGRMDPEISAPGYEIVSTALGDYYALTGTSMAVPFVSGAAVLLLEQNPSLTPAQVRAMLIQSTSNVTGKLFQRGTGELDVRNALTYNVHADVYYTNPYGYNVTNDRWEFVVTPYTTTYANITIINNNNHNITLNRIMDSITNMENDIQLSPVQIGMPSQINVTSNSNYSFIVNFTLTNFSSAYATTYGGLILLNGSGTNGSGTYAKQIRIPVAITVPILNTGYFNRTMQNDPTEPGYTNTQPTHEDVYYYCYYNENPVNSSVSINWSDSDDWLALFYYNSTGGFLTAAKDSGSNSQSAVSSDGSMFKWLRIDGYDFVAPMGFDINVTNPSNRAPLLINISPVNGSINTTSTILVYRSNNITINISYYDLDNDFVNVTINDSSYIFVSNGSSGANKSRIYSRAANSTIADTTSVIITLSDIYGSTNITTLNVLYLAPIVLNNYTSNSSELYITSNNSLSSILSFTVDATEINGNPLFYRWIINGTLNSTLQNFTFNASTFGGSRYALTLLVTSSNSSNSTNQTVNWIINIDNNAPSLNIASPLNMIYNDSIIDINYTLSDSSSGVDECLYSVNGTANVSNTTIASCVNTTIYLATGQYTVRLYVNDSVNNIVSSSAYFTINDATAASITGTHPSGSVGSVSSVVIRVNTTESATCRYDSSDNTYDSMDGSFNDYTTLHNATISVSAGSRTIYVRCSDLSGNVNTASTTINFSVSSGGGGGGSGGGSGGGGGSSSSPSGTGTGSTGASQKASIINGVIKVNFTNNNIPVSEVNVDVGNDDSNVSNVTINLQKITIYNSTPGRNVSAYLNLTSPNIPNENLSVKIYFNVKHEWIALNNITENDIVLLRYNPSTANWENLTTQYITEDNTSAFYVSTAPAFGVYAISYINETGGHGNVIILPKEEENKTINKSTEPQVHSTTENPGGVVASNSTISAEEISTIFSKQMEWIGWMMLGLFGVVGIITFVMHKYSIKKYEEDMIIETRHQFKDIQMPKKPGSK